MCKPIAKYSLESNTWKKVKKEDRKKAFSIVKYNTEFGNKNKSRSFEYFIIMKGMRQENYSKSGSGTGWGASNFLSALDKINEKIKVANILLDNDAPLEKQAQLVAKYVNILKEKEDCKKIHILGISKCGTMSIALLKYLTDLNLDKLNIIAYSSPYLGTIFASPVKLYKRLDDVVDEVQQTTLIKKIMPYLENIRPKINDEENTKTNRLTDIFKKVHWNVFSK